MIIWFEKKEKKTSEKGKYDKCSFSPDLSCCPCIAVFCTFFVAPFWFQTGLCDFCSTGGVLF